MNYTMTDTRTTRLSAQEWRAFLLNPVLTNEKDLQILLLVYHSHGHQNRAGRIGERLGYRRRAYAPVNAQIGRYAQKIAAARSEPLTFELRANGKPYWWTLFFNGWYQTGTSYFIWQLKPELCEALEQSGLADAVTDDLPEAIPVAAAKELWEGAKKTVTVNAYERNAQARRACLAHYGTYDCQICGFNFERAYGEWGKDFIHVHHVTPLADIGQSYQVNPVSDLIPVCPNCHAMLHRCQPPLSIEELKAKLSSSGAD